MTAADAHTLFFLGAEYLNIVLSSLLPAAIILILFGMHDFILTSPTRLPIHPLTLCFFSAQASASFVVCRPHQLAPAVAFELANLKQVL
jgi:hypothetical protein